MDLLLPYFLLFTFGSRILVITEVVMVLDQVNVLKLSLSQRIFVLKHLVGMLKHALIVHPMAPELSGASRWFDLAYSLIKH